MHSLKLFDCCWVEMEGQARAQLVIQVKRRPALFAVGGYLYAENARAVDDGGEAPAITFVHATTLPPRRRGQDS